MASNAIFFGWNRSIPGREHLSAEHFQQFNTWLNTQKANGTISSFENVFLRPHGGDLSGFVLIHGDSPKLHTLTETPEWTDHMVRGVLHLEGSGYVFADTGAEVMTRLQQWTKAIPRT